MIAYLLLIVNFRSKIDFEVKFVLNKKCL